MFRRRDYSVRHVGIKAYNPEFSLRNQVFLHFFLFASPFYQMGCMI